MHETTSATSAQILAERFCYRGSVDDWSTISSPSQLNKLLDQFVRFGKQSFYELFPY
jgi:hypothetical protein